MTRVSENSTTNAVSYSVGQTKSRLEDLQLKGSNLKRIQKPSDDPVGNIELLAIRSRNIDGEQYMRNASFAKTQLSFTEAAIEELTEVVQKAKEIAVNQASNIYNPDVRLSVAKEIGQLRNQAIGISNRRLGNKFLFSGHKTLTKPFGMDGKYQGDKGKISIEVSKDFFVPVNFDGEFLFFEKGNTKLAKQNELELDAEKFKQKEVPAKKLNQDSEIQKQDKRIQPESDAINRTLASVDKQPSRNLSRASIFDDLRTLENALSTNSHVVIQSLLEKFDEHTNRLIQTRTQVGSLMNSIDNAEGNLEKDKVANETYKSKIEDADVAELFSDLSKQQAILQATYQTSSKLMNKSLLDFIR